VPDAQTTEAYQTIRHETADGVATITLNRPNSLNALDATMRRELSAALKAATRDDATRAVILTGEGRGFCSGADLRGGAGERDFRRVLTNEYNPLITAIRELPKPVIAAVNGVAAGAGASLAFAADLIVAAEEARFLMAFVKIGLVPDSAATRTLVRALGRHAATEMIFTGEPLTARGAADAGLVAGVVPASELMTAAGELAHRLANGPTKALGYAKRLINAAEDATLAAALHEEADLQELAGRTGDHAEGIAAFTEKREPRFSGT
jgi:2-(1,2-epoxy-1,2-dihydrophenyl)acetyl-CoA isomerase